MLICLNIPKGIYRRQDLIHYCIRCLSVGAVFGKRNKWDFSKADVALFLKPKKDVVTS